MKNGYSSTLLLSADKRAISEDRVIFLHTRENLVPKPVRVSKPAYQLSVTTAKMVSPCIG